MVEDHDAIELDVLQRGGDPAHIVVAVVHEGFDKVGQGRTYVAEVDFPDLRGAEIADHLLGVLAGEGASTFEPGAAAQTDPDVRATGDLHGALVPFEIAEDAARYAGQDGNRRIVGMD